jgi:hypothetical protein
MACPGFSIPARSGCPAYKASLAVAETENKDAICSRCYAAKHRYKWGNVKKVLEWRQRWWLETAPKARATAIAVAVEKEGSPRYFRCYDSGDLDLSAFETWHEVAELLPDTLLWIPTRTWILSEYLSELVKLNRHPRIVVRPSSICFDDSPPDIPGLAAGLCSSYRDPVKTDRVCPGQCGKCRLCWTRPDLSVNFARK